MAKKEEIEQRMLQAYLDALDTGAEAAKYAKGMVDWSLKEKNLTAALLSSILLRLTDFQFSFTGMIGEFRGIILDLRKSSGRLENLTKVLIILTIVLAVLTTALFLI